VSPFQSQKVKIKVIGEWGTVLAGIFDGYIT